MSSPRDLRDPRDLRASRTSALLQTSLAHAKALAVDIHDGVIRLLFPATFIYLYFIFTSAYAIGVVFLNILFTLVAFIVYQVILLVAGFCYFRMIITTNTTTLELFPQIDTEEESSSSEESLHLNPFEMENSDKLSGRAMGFCDICKTYKPPRARHCDVCNKCYLLRIKHSIWFDTCICFSTYKFYVLFLFYTLLISCLSAGCFIHGITLCVGDLVEEYLAVFIVALSLQILLLVLLVLELYECVRNILNNETQSEREERRERERGRRDRAGNKYFLGYYENWKKIMGKKWYEWAMPAWTTQGDGIYFSESHANLA